MIDKDHMSATGDTLAEFKELVRKIADTDHATLKWGGAGRSFREYRFILAKPGEEYEFRYILRHYTFGIKHRAETVVKLDVERYALQIEGVKGIRSVYRLKGNGKMSRTLETLEWTPSSLELSEEELLAELKSAIAADLPRAKKSLRVQMKIGFTAVSEAEMLAVNRVLRTRLVRLQPR